MQDIECGVGGQSSFEVRLQAGDVLYRVHIVSSGAFFKAGQSAEPNDLLGLPDWNPKSENISCNVICDSTSREVCTREIECVSALSEGSLACYFVSKLSTCEAEEKYEKRGGELVPICILKLR